MASLPHTSAPRVDGAGVSWAILTSIRVSLPSAGPEHDDADPGETDDRSHDVGRVGRDAVHDPAPREREDDEDAAVRGVDAAEVRRLVRRHDAVQDEHERAEQPDEHAGAVSPPLPDEIAAADLGETGGDEEQERPRHAPAVAAERPAMRPNTEPAMSPAPPG